MLPIVHFLEDRWTPAIDLRKPYSIIQIPKVTTSNHNSNSPSNFGLKHTLKCSRKVGQRKSVCPNRQSPKIRQTICEGLKKHFGKKFQSL